MIGKGCFLYKFIYICAEAFALFNDVPESKSQASKSTRQPLAPLMGWNSWNGFGCNINHTIILNQAKLLVSLGLREAGYQMVVIDDCYQEKSRDARTGKLQVSAEKFPLGMLNLSREIHALGLHVGIYSSAGTRTCGGFPGSLDNEEIDAKTFAEWEIDYLKYDNCFNQGRHGTPLLSYDRYKKMGDALLKINRNISFAICNWGQDQVWNFAQTIASSWRISGDIAPVFSGYDDRCPCTSAGDCWMPGFHCSILNILEKAAPLLQKNVAGGYADLDMLEVGNPGLEAHQEWSHFVLWALVKSPLIIGADLSLVKEETVRMLKNRGVIEMHQDAGLGQARRVWTSSSSYSSLSAGISGDGVRGTQGWVVSVGEKSAVVAVLNDGLETVNGVSLNWKQVLGEMNWWPRDNRDFLINVQEFDHGLKSGDVNTTVAADASHAFSSSASFEIGALKSHHIWVAKVGAEESLLTVQ